MPAAAVRIDAAVFPNFSTEPVEFVERMIGCGDRCKKEVFFTDPFFQQHI